MSPAEGEGRHGRVQSMTGFASDAGEAEGVGWSIDLRGVNSRGLDLRLRLPDWPPGLETEVRRRLQAALSRGNVTLNLRLVRTGGGDAAAGIDDDALASAIAQVAHVEAMARVEGLALAPTRATDLLAMRGVLTTQDEDRGDDVSVLSVLLSAVERAIEAFVASRAAEGASLAAILTQHLDEIDGLVAAAGKAAAARGDRVKQSMQDALARVAGLSDPPDESRMAQELAVIAVKGDVTEEIDRLGAHVERARTLLGQGGPIGRKLDFLTQEFNREANTLCAKAGDGALTEIGLELKAVIDRMREQVQNVE